MSRGPVKIERYNSSWPIRYEKYEEELLDKLKDIVIEIAHIGSTSIEGLGAKPIIDIIITTEDIDNTEIIEKMEDLGYIYNDKYEDDFPFRRYFVLKDEEKHLVHVHVVPKGHQFYKDHIAFRDYLINHTDIRDEYHFLKTRLANKYKDDREGYQTGKSKFIERTLKMASGEE